MNDTDTREDHQGLTRPDDDAAGLQAIFDERRQAPGISPDEPTQQGASLLDDALAYHRRDWSIIPIKRGTKKPACKSWKSFQEQRPDEAKLRRWFANGKNHGLAVICGEVSGGLVCRDFDVMDAYEQWARRHPDLAATLPTVATVRGRHVYFRAAPCGIVKLEDGELRGGGYCLLPPSRHPDGVEYRWLVPLPDGELPEVADVCAAGFLDDASHATESTEKTECTEDNRGKPKRTEQWKTGRLASQDDGIIDGDIDKAILESLPASVGQRHRQVFDLARALKAISRLTDADPEHLEPAVRRWHTLGLRRGVIGTEPFEEAWIDFLKGWPRVRFPKGAEPMAAIFQKAKQADLPVVAERYESDGVRLLVALCRELQRAAGQQPFFLACRTAGRLLDVDHTTANRWLFLLIHDNVIDEVEKGSRTKRRASRYRYLGD